MKHAPTAHARLGTYSIVARDPDSGELGVAVQSHWFSVGSSASWAEPGIGAVATQANVDPSYGPEGLRLLRAGSDAPEALERLTAQDPLASHRQVAMVDRTGTAAVHTGTACVPHAGHVAGESYSCQGNMLGDAAVWNEMAAEFRAANGSLSERLLAALDAGEAAGGDVRGRQSAALLVVGAAGEGWRRAADIRVDDHPNPLAELRRLALLNDAYRAADEGAHLAAEARHREAAAAYGRACELAPDSAELLFWSGLGRVHGGELDAGAAQVRRAITLEPGWRTLLERLPAEVAPAAPAVRERLARDEGS